MGFFFPGHHYSTDGAGRTGGGGEICGKSGGALRAVRPEGVRGAQSITVKYWKSHWPTGVRPGPETVLWSMTWV